LIHKNHQRKKRRSEEEQQAQIADECHRKKALYMCSSCASKDETPLSSDREKWPIGKIEIGCFDEICKLLDLAYCSKKPLMNALGGLDQTTAAGIKITY
jgi:hypothetical protein